MPFWTTSDLRLPGWSAPHGRVLGIARCGTEPRIDRVVAWPPVFDWLYWLPAVMRGPVRTMLRRRRLMRWSVRTRARLIPTLRQIVDHTLYLVDGDDPVEVVDWFLGMNAYHLGSAQVTQDVLLMCGKHDSFQFACSQKPSTLINTARSATSASPAAC